MPKTQLTISGEQFLVNGTPIYAEVDGTHPESHGLMMNARFIQGIFDDKEAPSRFARFGQATLDAEANTDRLIEALPDWYRYGLELPAPAEQFYLQGFEKDVIHENQRYIRLASLFPE